MYSNFHLFSRMGWMANLVCSLNRWACTHTCALRHIYILISYVLLYIHIHDHMRYTSLRLYNVERLVSMHFRIDFGVNFVCNCDYDDEKRLLFSSVWRRYLLQWLNGSRQYGEMCRLSYLWNFSYFRQVKTNSDTDFRPIFCSTFS